MPTLVELNYNPKHAPLKEFLSKAVETAKSSANGANYLVYRPLLGTSGSDKTVYVWFRSDKHAPALKDSHSDSAVKLARAAKKGVNDRGNSSYSVSHSSGDHTKPSPYLLVIGLHPSSDAKHKAAAKALRDANSGRDAVPYAVLKGSKRGNPDLLVFPLKDLSDLHEDGSLNKARLVDHAGADAALKHAEALRGRKHSTTVLRYAPEVSNP